MTDQNDPMAEIRASFFIECEELLEALQDGLQTMDEGDDDTETINIVFRAVHSIKGGAGAFGLEALVRFAHRFETVLDEIRAGRMTPDPEALKLFFQCADHLSDLVRFSRDDAEMPEAETVKLLTRLDDLLGEDAAHNAPEAEPEQDIKFQPAMLSFDLDIEETEGEADFQGASQENTPSLAGKASYVIVFTPENELFETGNEPFHMLRALDEMGHCTVTCDASRLPTIDKLSAEITYLSWTIELVSDVEEAEISAAFEFVEGLCTLKISQIMGTETPPHSIVHEGDQADAPPPDAIERPQTLPANEIADTTPPVEIENTPPEALPPPQRLPANQRGRRRLRRPPNLSFGSTLTELKGL